MPYVGTGAIQNIIIITPWLLPHELVFAVRWNETDAMLSLELAQFHALMQLAVVYSNGCLARPTKQTRLPHQSPLTFQYRSVLFHQGKYKISYWCSIFLSFKSTLDAMYPGRPYTIARTWLILKLLNIIQRWG